MTAAAATKARSRDPPTNEQLSVPPSPVSRMSTSSSQRWKRPRIALVSKAHCEIRLRRFMSITIVPLALTLPRLSL